MGVNRLSIALTCELSQWRLLAAVLTEFGCRASNCKRKHSCPLGKKEGHKYFSGVQSCVSSDVTTVQIGRQLEESWLSFGWYEKVEMCYSSWGGRVNTDSCAYLSGMMCCRRMCIGRSNSSFVEELAVVCHSACKSVMNGMKT